MPRERVKRGWTSKKKTRPMNLPRAVVGFWHAARTTLGFFYFFIFFTTTASLFPISPLPFRFLPGSGVVFLTFQLGSLFWDIIDAGLQNGALELVRSSTDFLGKAFPTLVKTHLSTWLLYPSAEQTRTSALCLARILRLLLNLILGRLLSPAPSIYRTRGRNRSFAFIV